MELGWFWHKVKLSCCCSWDQFLSPPVPPSSGTITRRSCGSYYWSGFHLPVLTWHWKFFYFQHYKGIYILGILGFSLTWPSRAMIDEPETHGFFLGNSLKVTRILGRMDSLFEKLLTKFFDVIHMNRFYARSLRQINFIISIILSCNIWGLDPLKIDRATSFETSCTE